MSGSRSEAPAVSLSVRLYRGFLWMYPEPFRREYGQHMVQLFRDYALRVHRQEGPAGLVSFWALTLLDWLRSVVEQHLEKETLVTRNSLIRLSGWAMAVGGVASAFGFLLFMYSEAISLRVDGVWEGVFVTAFFYGPIGVGLGLLGLRARYGEGFGQAGKLAMILGALGGLGLLTAGNVVQSMTNDLGDNGFGIWALGLIITFITLGVYGILAAVQKAQGRGNGLAAVAALPVVIIAVLASITRGGSGPGPIGLAPLVLFTSLFVMMGASLAMLGYQLQAGLPEQSPTRAESS